MESILAKILNSMNQAMVSSSSEESRLNYPQIFADFKYPSKKAFQSLSHMFLSAGP